MDQLTKARLESKPIELADAALAAIKRRSPESGNSLEVAEWQRDVNAAAELRRVVGEFVHGMPDEYGPLDLIDNIISCQSIWAMPSQTELIQLRNEVAKLVEDKNRLDSGAAYRLRSFPPRPERRGFSEQLMSEVIEYRKLVAELRERAGFAELENTATARSDARYFREAASALEDLIELAERVEAAAEAEVKSPAPKHRRTRGES